MLLYAYKTNYLWTLWAKKWFWEELSGIINACQCNLMMRIYIYIYICVCVCVCASVCVCIYTHYIYVEREKKNYLNMIQRLIQLYSDLSICKKRDKKACQLDLYLFHQIRVCAQTWYIFPNYFTIICLGRLLFHHGILTEGEGSVQLTSLFWLQQTLFTLYKTSYLNEEVNRTEPSPSVSVPWFHPRTGRPRTCHTKLSFLYFKL